VESKILGLVYMERDNLTCLEVREVSYWYTGLFSSHHGCMAELDLGIVVTVYLDPKILNGNIRTW
jgi:hypothetical protein